MHSNSAGDVYARVSGAKNDALFLVDKEIPVDDWTMVICAAG